MNEVDITELIWRYQKSQSSLGKSIRWLTHCATWGGLDLTQELPNFRKSLSSGMDANFSDDAITGIFKKLEVVVSEKFILNMAESFVGSPRTCQIVTRGGTTINCDGSDLNQVYIANRVQTLWRSVYEEDPIRILDIGGGYGSLANKLGKLFPQAKISIIDTPEANLLQAFYLSSNYSREQVGYQDEDIFEHKFSVLPISSFNLLTSQSWDLIINSASMQEMEPKVVSDYFTFIHENIRPGGVFYNSNSLVAGASGFPYHISRSPYDDRWAFLSSTLSFTQRGYFEICTLRLSFENTLFRRYLKTLPTNNVWREGIWAFRRKPMMLIDQLGSTYFRSFWDTLKRIRRLW
jgi:putative sugar O-methyltransferase